MSQNILIKDFNVDSILPPLFIFIFLIARVEPRSHVASLIQPIGSFFNRYSESTVFIISTIAMCIMQYNKYDAYNNSIICVTIASKFVSLWTDMFGWSCSAQLGSSCGLHWGSLIICWAGSSWLIQNGLSWDNGLCSTWYLIFKQASQAHKRARRNMEAISWAHQMKSICHTILAQDIDSDLNICNHPTSLPSSTFAVLQIDSPQIS